MATKKEVKGIVSKTNSNSTLLKGIGLAGSVLVSSFWVWQQIKPRMHPTIPPLIDEWHPFMGHFSWFSREVKNGTFPMTLSKLLNETHKDKKCLHVAGPEGRIIVFLNDPKLVKWIFTDKFELFGKSGDDFEARVQELLGNGIFSVDGNAWRFHRKVASRMFSMKNLKNYMYNCARNASARAVNKLASLSGETMENPVDINDMMGRFTLDSFIEIAFGKSLKIIESAPEPHSFGVAFDELQLVIAPRFREPWWKLGRALNIGREAIVAKNAKIVDNFVRQLLDLESRRKLVDETGDAVDLLSLYIKHDPKISYNELKDVALSMIIAGRDTTRMLLSWFFVIIFKNQDKLAKVKSEIQSFKEISYDIASKKMVYTEKCLLETLRLYPSVTGSFRRVQAPSVTLPTPEKHVLKRLVSCSVNHYSAGRNPRIFSDPESFKPERWTNGFKTFDESEYVVFNQAPRVCLGRTFSLLEAKVFLWHFFQRFDYVPVSDEIPVFDLGAILNA